MRYHTKTQSLLDMPASAGHNDLVSHAEQKLGLRFPESVREWYSVIDGRQVLATYSNADSALDPAQFERVSVCGKDLVKVLVENQGVCWWGFELNGSEDPPVYVNLDPPPDTILEYASTFSQFTYVRVFDFGAWFQDDRFVLETREPVREAALRELREMFEVEPISLGWPGTTNYRFSSPLGRIIIWHGEEQADWILSAPSTSAFDQLKRLVMPLW